MRRKTLQDKAWKCCRKGLIRVLAVMLACCPAGCSDDDAPTSDPEEVQTLHEDNIYVFLSPNGPGDNGYNDQIVEAVSEFAFSREVGVHLSKPNSMSDVNDYLDVLWSIYGEREQGKTLVVLAASEYEALALSRSAVPNDRFQVLLFESEQEDLPEGFSTFHLSRYGISYAVGAMVARQRAEIIAAMPDVVALEDAIKGFKDGYAAHGARWVPAVHYLSTDYRGFTMQKKARQLTDSLQRAYNDVPCYGTIYPLAGYANHGIYAGIRDVNLLISNLWGIGMDVDCSAQTDYTPFSVIVDIASLLRWYLADWLEGKDLPRKAVYGMQEGYTGMVFGEGWDPYGLFSQWEDSTSTEMFLPKDFWIEKYEKVKDEAIRKEEEYERK